MIAIFSLKRRQACGASDSASTCTLVTRNATSRFSCATLSATVAGWRQGETRLEGGERLLLLAVAIVIAADQKQRIAAFDRIGRFEVGVVGAGRDMVIAGGGQVLRQTQPDQAVIGAGRDRAGQVIERLGIALRAVFFVGIASQPHDQTG